LCMLFLDHSLASHSGCHPCSPCTWIPHHQLELAALSHCLVHIYTGGGYIVLSRETVCEEGEESGEAYCREVNAEAREVGCELWHGFLLVKQDEHST
jgi:hypothetical protein